ncbi:hypothetical protein ACOSP7_024269 [Xanthoceras sorbifolium]
MTLRRYKTLGRKLKATSADPVRKKVVPLLAKKRRLPRRALSKYAFIRKKRKAATIICRDEPNRIQHSLNKTARATVPLSFVPPLPDITKETIPPIPSAEHNIDVLVHPPFTSRGQIPHVGDPSHLIPHSADDILKSATARSFSLKDCISAKWVLFGSLEHQIRSYMDFTITFLANIDVAAKERDIDVHEKDIVAKERDTLYE